MNTKKPTNRWELLPALVIVLLLAAALPLVLRAQGELSLLWGNVSSGYSNSEGDDFRIAATAGQVDGTLPVTGDGFQITGGVWAFIEEPPPAPQPPPPPDHDLFLPVTIR